ncbi:low molecular weight protein-tyrosine-phosphatase [Marinimicrobium agarilyticum]|uniref:low molecular weight protein-tyrosine-phosphatase n=1 Tax=Marinimicrobium agarilyticum TaxID=306546 RepID=UPI0003F57F5A|nr:low molecular weight protein-tyrosine-phosphatase [Marinimicrobium agarilyticum]
MTVNVLFVCLGNICRSPTAHGIFEQKVKNAGLQDEIVIDSAGTGGWHIGKSPDARASQFALERGYDLSHLRARQTDPSDFLTYQYILAMDNANLADLKRMKPSSYKGHLGLFLDFGDNPQYREVPDPYYGGDDGFQLVLDLVESACDGLLLDIRHQL